MPHAIRELSGHVAMDYLTSQWRDLYHQDSEATPYQSPQWLAGWAEQLPYTATPVVLVAQAPTGRTLAALALAREDQGGTGAARMYPLSAPIAEYVRPIGPHAEDSAIAGSFAFYLTLLAAEGERVEMTDVPTTSSLGHYLAQTCADGAWGHGTTECAEIRLPLDFQSMPRSSKRDHQRRQRTWSRLADGHRVVYHRTRHTKELLVAYGVLADLHERQRASEALLPGSTFAAGSVQWRAVLERCASTAFIATLAVDGVAIAAQLCLVRGRDAFAVVPAVDPGHRHLAPGHALLRHLAVDLASEGFQTLDLGRTAPGQHAYKAQYRPRWNTTVSAVSTPQASAA